MADERSVDVDEPRDTPPPAESGPRLPLATVTSRLSPMQQAYADYTGHATRCLACRDVDRSCGQAEALWRVYQAVGADTYERMADETQ